MPVGLAPLPHASPPCAAFLAAALPAAYRNHRAAPLASSPCAQHGPPRPPRPSLLRRLLSPFRRKRQPNPQKKPPASPDEWRALIAEFEARANAKYSTRLSAPPPPPPAGWTPGKENEAQYESLPYVETAFMAALTTLMWYLGRVLRLDALLLLMYPLPTMYVAARYGLFFADRALTAILFLAFTLLGPVYAQFYLLNSGLLTFVYARALWWRWTFWPTLLAGAVAKGVGLVLQLAWASVVLRYSAWRAVTVQVTGMLTGMVMLANRVFGRELLGLPQTTQVQIGIVCIVALHSLYHVFFTLLSSVLLLRSVPQERLARRPGHVPGISWLLKKAEESRNDPYQ